MAIDDADRLPAETELTADVCIIGGGPAGISVALALASSKASVILLESGGTSEETSLQDLNRGENVGLGYYQLDETRYRLLGGSSERWAGWCLPMDRSDFDARPWVPTTGWPIAYETMVPYYRQAALLCELGEVEFSPPKDHDIPAIYRRPFVGEDVEIVTWQGSPPTKFGRVYRDDLEEGHNLTVLTHATAVEVLTNDEATHATGVRVVAGSGQEFKVSASTVVLCAGAIETARLLLASRSARPNGLGNEHDLVGRHFMEHPHLVTARLELLPPGMTRRPFVGALDRGFFGTRERLAMQRPKGTAKIAYTISDQRKRRDQLLNFSTHIRTVSKISREDSDAYQAFKLVVNNMRSPLELSSQVMRGTLPLGASEQMKRILLGTPEILQLVYHEGLKRPTELAFYTQSEQVPNPDSRVTLDDTNRDASGLPRVILNWRLSRIDKESIMTAHEILATRFLASGLGVLVPEPAFRDDGPDWGPGLRGGHHHMGTVRMADDPRDGVVDSNGRVHSVRGLYVGDSGVFPTGGFANPLLTLVALAWRLGKHLERSLQ